MWEVNSEMDMRRVRGQVAACWVNGALGVDKWRSVGLMEL